MYCPSDVTVIICAYSDERWPDLVAAVDSVRSQTTAPGEIVVAIDHNPVLLRRAAVQWSDVVVIENSDVPGASAARNKAAAAAHGSILAFLDDDAVAEPDWLECLLPHYSDVKVLGIGGSLQPVWAQRRPRWFPEEFNWVLGCTYRGLPETTNPVRNLIAANMSVRRDVFMELGGFRRGYGNVKVDSPLQLRLFQSRAGDEETELCIRGLQRWPNGLWMYVPQARVQHKVAPNRARCTYFLTRCYDEGYGKAVLSRLVGVRDGLASERRYTIQTIPQGIGHGILDVVRGDLAGLARASAILAGLVVTTAGYLVGSIHMGLTKKVMADRQAPAVRQDSAG